MCSSWQANLTGQVCPVGKTPVMYKKGAQQLVSDQGSSRAGRNRRLQGQLPVRVVWQGASAGGNRAGACSRPKGGVDERTLRGAGRAYRERTNVELLHVCEESRKTVLFVTHDTQEAVFLCSRVVVLTSSPARMAEDIPINLPYPRKLDINTQEDFPVYTRRIYGLLGMD